jgi:hypothetical protein
LAALFFIPSWFRIQPPSGRTECRAKTLVSLALLFLACHPLGDIVMAETLHFDTDALGAAPAGWIAGVTGRGSHHWSIETDATAPSKPNVLKQSGKGDFPWCVVRGAMLADGSVEVRFKPIAGKEDQAGGIVWRWKDGNHYYVARANALENNVSLYYTENGRRNTIKYVNAPVAANAWHTLAVDFAGTRIRVSLDGKAYIELDDDHIAGPGAVGVWTKADSVTLFDDFRYDTRR